MSKKHRASVLYGEKSLASTVSHSKIYSSDFKKSHSVILNKLKPRGEYNYQIKTKDYESPLYNLSTVYNDTVRPVSTTSKSKLISDRVDEFLKAGMDIKGYGLIIGAKSNDLPLQLAAKSNLILHTVEHDLKKVKTARDHLYSMSIYGTRLTVRQCDKKSELPFRNNFFNTVICMDASQQYIKEVCRVLRPRSLAFVEGLVQPYSLRGLKVELVSSTNKRSVLRKKIVDGAGSWTHQYGSPANNSHSDEDLNGATRTDQLEIQWFGRPGGDFGIDRGVRMPAPLCANGRLFHQGLYRIIAIDQYNGSIIWNLEIPALRRINIPRDSSNWCLDDDHLYVLLRNQLWMIEARTGKVLSSLEVSDYDISESKPDWGFLASYQENLIATAVRQNTHYTAWWGKEGWYDSIKDQSTGKVCSDTIFAIDKVSHEKKWEYKSGLIVNSSIAIDKEIVYFCETRDASLMSIEKRRIIDRKMWDDFYLVALDSKTGEKVWEQRLENIKPGHVVFYLCTSQAGVVLMSSVDKKYFIYLYDHQTGDLIWEVNHKWTQHHHSGHMQRPVVVGDKLFIEPIGYDLKSGKVVHKRMGKREGCHTYLGTNRSLIYRGRGRNIAMWDIEKEETSLWPSLRPSCWLSMIPGGGMMLVPEGGAGCSCGKWIESSFGFSPKTWGR
jgi:outer membrane protein assembly factor BamB